MKGTMLVSRTGMFFVRASSFIPHLVIGRLGKPQFCAGPVAKRQTVSHKLKWLVKNFGVNTGGVFSQLDVTAHRIVASFIGGELSYAVQSAAWATALQIRALRARRQLSYLV